MYQASVNYSQTLLAFVVKNPVDGISEENVDRMVEMQYRPFLVEINNKGARPPKPLLEMGRTKQVMVQFLWRKQSTFEKQYQDKFLVLIHGECNNCYFFILKIPFFSIYKTNFVLVYFSHSLLYEYTEKAPKQAG